MDFIFGLARSTSADTAEAKQAPSGWEKTKLCVETYIQTLNEVDREEDLPRQRAKMVLKI